MKKFKRYNILWVLIAFFVFNACDPMEMEKPDSKYVEAPTADQMDFTIQQGEDEFHFVITNNSTATGYATWSLGNGNTAKGDDVIAYYPMPGEYEITLTLSTNGGSGEIKKPITTTETDYALFTDPVLVAICGGAEAIEGKTWVIDSTQSGHLGVGPAESYAPDWWAAQPLGKSGHFIYDDEFTFKLVDFEYVIDTHGKTHANGDGGAADRGLDAGFYTSILWEDAYDKDVATNDEARGNLTWSLVKEGETNYIVLSSYSAVLGYDGGNERKYEILDWNENRLYVRSVGGAARYHAFIPKGYERPSFEYTVNVAQAGGVNNWQAGLSVTNIPDGEAIDSFMVDFGNGTVISTDNANSILENTYMRKGAYNVVLTVYTTLGEESETVAVDVLDNHPDYEPFLLDVMVMYNDFSEVSMAPLQGQDCAVKVVDNPDIIYPNKSTKVMHYLKENQEWANAFMQLPAGYRFDLRQQSAFKIKVRGKAGMEVLLKLENTERGANAWQTGVELKKTIQQDDTWEVMTFDFSGVFAGWDWTGDIFTADVVTDDRFNHDFYDIVRIMLNPGNKDGVFEFYFDELSGPHVEGLKSLNL